MKHRLQYYGHAKNNENSAIHTGGWRQTVDEDMYGLCEDGAFDRCKERSGDGPPTPMRGRGHRIL